MDPLAALSHTISPYAYSSNDPINRIAPLGLTDYYNLNGKLVYHVDDDLDDIYLVFTSKTTLDAIQEAIGNDNFILLPSLDIVSAMEDIFKVKDNFERGFCVGMNGSMSSILIGTESLIERGLWESAIGELTGFGDRYSYDVHLHPYYTLLDGSYTLETPSITDIIESHDRKNVVLGYKRINDSSLTSGFRLQRFITIYSSEGVLVSIPFNDFLRTFKKIQKK